MSLEAVKEDILASARQQAEEKRKETQKVAAEIKAKAKEDAKNNLDLIKEKTKTLLAAIEQQELALAHSEAKRILLDSQKAMLDSVMDSLQEKIVALTAKKRDQYCSRLLKKAQKEMSTKYVYTNAKDKKCVSGAGLVQKDANILGGIIAEDKEGVVRIDYSFETVLDEVRKKELPKVAKELW